MEGPKTYAQHRWIVMLRRPNRRGHAFRSTQLAALVLILATHISCRSEENTFGRARSITRVALIGISKDHPTWPVLQATARQLSGHGGRLEIAVDAPASSSPREQQE